MLTFVSHLDFPLFYQSVLSGTTLYSRVALGDSLSPLHGMDSTFIRLRETCLGSFCNLFILHVIAATNCNLNVLYKTFLILFWFVVNFA